MADISVVIPHYYAAREPNLSTIVGALMGGTVKPCEVLVWCNESLSAPLRGASAIVSHRNVGSQARFLAALAAVGEYVVFLDNDVCPEQKTLENLLRWAQPSVICTLEGRAYSAASYRACPKLYGRQVKEPQRVELSLGRGEIVWRLALPRLLQHFPFGPDTVMDDMWFSAAAALEGIPIHVVPAIQGESSLVNLPEFGVGLSLRKEFYPERDAALRQIAMATNGK